MRLQTSSRGRENNQRHISSSFREINRKKTGCYPSIHPSITHPSIHPSIQAGGDAWNPGGHMGKTTTSQESNYKYFNFFPFLFSLYLFSFFFLFFFSFSLYFFSFSFLLCLSLSLSLSLSTSLFSLLFAFFSPLTLL